MSQISPRALLLDMDGTLADSLGLMRLAFSRLMGELNLPNDEAAFQSLNGPPLSQCCRILVDRHGLAIEPGVILERWLGILNEEYPNVRPMPGARDLLKAASDLGWRRCLVTSAGHAMAQTWLDRSGLAPLVPLVVGGDDVARGKPYPDPYLAALALTGATAENALAVEDSASGAEAAIAAGIKTLVIGGHEPAPARARRLSSLAEVLALVEAW